MRASRTKLHRKLRRHGVITHTDTQDICQIPWGCSSWGTLPVALLDIEEARKNSLELEKHTLTHFGLHVFFAAHLHKKTQHDEDEDLAVRHSVRHDCGVYIVFAAFNTFDTSGSIIIIIIITWLVVAGTENNRNCGTKIAGTTIRCSCRFPFFGVGR